MFYVLYLDMNKTTKELNMRTYLNNYNSTHYTAISGKKFFKINEGDMVQIRDIHELDSDDFVKVIHADRRSVSVAVNSTFDVRTYELDRVYQVVREGKKSTVRATFPCNWSGADLVPYKITGNIVRVFDLKLKIVWTEFEDGKHFEAYSSHDGKNYDDYIMVEGFVNSNGWTEAMDEGRYTTRDSNFWADAMVRVIANIY
jgi:hypothetical protein